MITGGPFVQLEAARLVGNAEGLPIVRTLFKPVKIEDLMNVFKACREGNFEENAAMWSVKD